MFVIMQHDKSKYFRLIAILLSIFYLVGIAGILSPFRDFILPLTPLNLMLTAACLFFFHEAWDKKFLFFAIVTVIVGFGAEVFGVATGILFGHYEYGPNLGPKLFEVPPIIGLNWLLLVYSIGCLVGRYILYNPLLQAIVAAFLMTSLDYLIEPVAMKAGFWNWDGGIVPIQNYAGWLLVSFIMFSLFFTLRLQNRNPMAAVIVGIQLVFFGVLNIGMR
jgi:uncharacterized membrane protein